MQKIILFVEPSDDLFVTPVKIGDLFMNRFAIDENASCEILKTVELVKTSREISWINNKNFAEERNQKRMDHFIVIVNNKIYVGYSSWFDPINK